MVTTYSWVIPTLECYTQHDNKENVVFTIHWRRQAVAGKYMVDTYGTKELTYDPTSSFTPYENLTRTQVESWLEEAMGDKVISELDANLDRQLANLVNPPLVTLSIPWTV